MATPGILLALQDTALAAYVRGDVAGAEWAFPIIETVHVLALATVYGTIVMVDLRMLGLVSRDARVSRLTGELLPWTWTAFAVAVCSGALLYMSKAGTYWNNPQAQAKFVCMGLAGVNMLVYHFGTYRRVADWDTALPPPSAARLAGALSIALWTAIIFFGRWIGFTT
jgi:hypothetical protein